MQTYVECNAQYEFERFIMNITLGLPHVYISAINSTNHKTYQFVFIQSLRILQTITGVIFLLSYIYTCMHNVFGI